jgi:Arc/MetJ-type ribon-helix-helix transcriptional regulator
MLGQIKEIHTMQPLAEDQILRIQRLARDGEFASEEDALNEALDLLEREVEILRVRAKIRRGDEQFAQDGGHVLTDEWLAERAEAARTRYRERSSAANGE